MKRAASLTLLLLPGLLWAASQEEESSPQPAPAAASASQGQQAAPTPAAPTPAYPASTGGSPATSGASATSMTGGLGSGAAAGTVSVPMGQAATPPAAGSALGAPTVVGNPAAAAAGPGAAAASQAQGAVPAAKAAPVAPPPPQQEVATSKAWKAQARREFIIAIRHYIRDAGPEGIKVHDSVTGKDRVAKFSRLHAETVVQLDLNRYRVCGDFVSAENGKETKLDLDFYATNALEWKVDGVVIHKVDGVSRLSDKQRGQLDSAR